MPHLEQTSPLSHHEQSHSPPQHTSYFLKNHFKTIILSTHSRYICIFHLSCVRCMASSHHIIIIIILKTVILKEQHAKYVNPMVYCSINIKSKSMENGNYHKLPDKFSFHWPALTRLSLTAGNITSTLHSKKNGNLVVKDCKTFCTLKAPSLPMMIFVSCKKVTPKNSSHTATQIWHEVPNTE